MTIRMAIRTSDIPQIVIERIASAHPQPAHFGYFEICDWPDGVLNELIRAGLLIAADQAQSIVCPGCEWQCHKIPTVRLDAGGRRRAYITCDEEPKNGRIRVHVRSLDQYQSNARRLSECLAGLMGFESARPLASGNCYALGRVNGRHGNRTIGLVIVDAQIDITVGDHREPLLNVLSLSNSGLITDRGVVNRLANRKAKIGRGERVSDRSRQRARKRKTLARNAAIYREATKLKRPANSWSDVARLIEGTNLAPGLSFERIRKIISKKRTAERKKIRSNY